MTKLRVYACLITAALIMACVSLAHAETYLLKSPVKKWKKTKGSKMTVKNFIGIK